MNTAPILDFELFKQEKLWEHFSQMVHSALDKALAGLKDYFLSESKMTLKEMSDLFQDKKQEIASSMLQEFIQGKYASLLEQTHADCSQCGKTIRKQNDSSRIVETLLGAVEICRPYFYCRDCKLGFSPLDQELEFSPRRKQDDLQQIALEFVAEMPFERASELFEKSTGVPFSDHRMHDLVSSFVNETKVEDVIPSAEEIARRIDEATTSEKRRPVLVVTMDGAHAKIRPPGGRKVKRGPGGYKEVKGFRIYMPAQGRIIQIASWHQHTDETEQITEALKLAASRIPQERVRIGLIGDGAHWLWNSMTAAFPKGRQILDYYHCSEYVHKVGELQFADDPNKALHWVEATMARLFSKDGIRHVIAGLKRMQPKDEAAKEQIQKTITYLTNNKGRTGYKGAKIGGYPIGSGGIESANKFICHTRLKRSGAWWLKTNCNNMLKLRCSLVNGTFDNLFQKCATREKAKGLVRNA